MAERVSHVRENAQCREAPRSSRAALAPLALLKEATLAAFEVGEQLTRPRFRPQTTREAHASTYYPDSVLRTRLWILRSREGRELKGEIARPLLRSSALQLGRARETIYMHFSR